MHTVIDDHSRVAYAEIHDDELAVTAVAVLYRAVACFAERGVTVEKGPLRQRRRLVPHPWRANCADLGIIHKRTRPRRPQTNGKIERFHLTLANRWAFKKLYNSESARRAALPAWLHHYTTTGPTQASAGQHPSPG